MNWLVPISNRLEQENHHWQDILEPQGIGDKVSGILLTQHPWLQVIDLQSRSLNLPRKWWCNTEHLRMHPGTVQYPQILGTSQGYNQAALTSGESDNSWHNTESFLNLLSMNIYWVPVMCHTHHYAWWEVKHKYNMGPRSKKVTMKMVKKIKNYHRV